ncbi:MAG: hypothetical protein EON56_04485 [Alphaproteobacteria bacterium]|nr:MAG: hypothetical protein EON56_04485 [Alphaproteobacteria bacterium]
MAMSESIKRRVRLLEDECAWAENLARCFVDLAGDDPGVSSPLSLQFQRTVDALNSRAAALVAALHREARDV